MKGVVSRDLNFGFFGLFLMCSHQFLKGFLERSQCVPQGVPNSTALLSHMLCPKLNFHLYKL
jgi:hypothetical protein